MSAFDRFVDSSGSKFDYSMFVSHILPSASCCHFICIFFFSAYYSPNTHPNLVQSLPHEHHPFTKPSCPPTLPHPHSPFSRRAPHLPNITNVLPTPLLPPTPAQTQHTPHHLRKTTPRRLVPWRLRTEVRGAHMPFLSYRRRRRRTPGRNRK